MKERYFCTFYDAVKTMLPAGINYRLSTVYSVRAEDGGTILDEEKQRIYNYIYSKRKPVRLEKLMDDFALTDSRVPDEMVQDGLLYKSEEAFRRVNDAVTKMAAIAPNCDLSAHKLTPKQESAVELLQMVGAAPVKEVRYYTGVSSAVIDALVKKGIVVLFDEEVFRIGDRQPDDSIGELVLSDEQKRSRYDAMRSGSPFGAPAYGGGTQGYGAPADPFAGADPFGWGFPFGGAGYRRASTRRSRAYNPRAGADVTIDVELDQETARKGTRRGVTYQRYVACDVCHGSGSVESDHAETCPTCGGSGHISLDLTGLFGFGVMEMECPECEGAGKVVADPCEACGGSGRVLSASEVVNFSRPAFTFLSTKSSSPGS